MSKKILHTFVALAAALILTGGFSMTASAGGGEEYEVIETPAPEPEETINPSDPLTPEGNATLVDDIWGENKQLITVTTKNEGRLLPGGTFTCGFVISASSPITIESVTK